MNNKRLSFYFISFLILIGLYVVYVWALAPPTITLQTVVKNVSSTSGTLSKLNITTGGNLNITCSAQMFAVDTAEVAIANLSLFHNLNGTFGLNLTNATGTTTYNVTNLYNVSEQNGSLGLLSVTFVVSHNSSVTFDANGAFTGTNVTAEDGNYTFGCQAGYNVTNGSFTNVDLRNFSKNTTITIDRSRPNFTLSSLNVSDGTNTVTISALNATDGGTLAYLRNNSNLIVSVSVIEPNPDSARIFWTTNGAPIYVNLSTNNNNLTMNRRVSPSASLNTSVYNGSFRYAGVSTNIIDRELLAEGTVISFKIITNDSAGNINNLSNGDVGYNITLDGSTPNVIFTLDKSRVEVLTAVKGTCTSNDTSPTTYKITLTKPSGAQVSKTPDTGIATFTNIDTGEAGKYSVECTVTDSVQYSTTITKEFTAFYEAQDVDLGEEEAAPEVEKVAELDLSKKVDSQLPQGTFSGLQGESKTFTLDGVTEHRATLLEVKDQEVTLRLESTPVDVTLKIGETKEVDLDLDGESDLVVTLNSITDGKADVTLKPLKAKEVETEEKTEEASPGELTVEKTSSSTWLVVAVVLVVLIGVVAYLLLKKGKKGKKGEIKFTSKDLSSEFNF